MGKAWHQVIHSTDCLTVYKVLSYLGAEKGKGFCEIIRPIRDGRAGYPSNFRPTLPSGTQNLFRQFGIFLYV